MVGDSFDVSRPPALLVGGVRSGCGKTTLTLALLAALRARGIAVQACKAGPDFIDPAHHAALSGSPSYNLDAWMGGEGGLERAFSAALDALAATTPPQKPASPPPFAKMLLIEGVMGLFDGASSPRLHGEGEGSSAEVARRCKVPVLLVVDVRGMAQSAAAIVQGFLSYKPDISYAGIVCTHVGGPRHQQMLREALSNYTVPLLGLLPREGAPQLPSRHLGLLMPHEVDLHAATLANWLELHLDVDALLDALRVIAQAKTDTDRPDTKGPKPGAGTDKMPEVLASPVSAPLQGTKPTIFAPRIAIAYDKAFCFLYPDFPTVLRELGARPVFFSPLRDKALPPCEAVYLPGGYPELFAQELADNAPLRDALRSYAHKGGTVYGECGGYMYLMQSITTTAGTWPMSACLPLACQVGDKRAALGYRAARPAGLAAQFWGSAAHSVRGHEYHYAHLLPSAPDPTPVPLGTPGPALSPLWEVHDAAGNPLPAEGSLLGRCAGSWLHLYPQGARPLLKTFLQGLSL